MQGPYQAYFDNLTAALTLVFLVGTVFLLCCAGRRREADTFVLNWTDKIPYDLYLFAMGWGSILCFAFAFNLLGEGYAYHYGDPSFYVMAGASAAAMTVGYALTEAGLMSTASRCKTHTLLRNTLVWKCLRWVGRGCGALGRWWRTTFGSWSMTHRIIVGFLLYLTGTVLTSLTVILIPFYQLRDAANVIADGDYQRRVDRPGTDEIGQVSQSFNRMADRVEEHIHTLAEMNEKQRQLLGSLAHELKTPMTGIQGYAELLQRVELPTGKQSDCLHYIEEECKRLSRLSAKMLQLTELSDETVIEKTWQAVEGLFEQVRQITRFRL